MEQFDKDIFLQLVSDADFVRWGKGKPCVGGAKWEGWKSKNPSKQLEFDEAIQLVQRLAFSSEKISSEEILYLWKKTEDQINRKRSPRWVNTFTIGFARVAAVLIVPLLLYSVWVSIEQEKLKSEYFSSGYGQQQITVFAPVGARSFVDLPDGSKAWLNSETKLSYPAIFSGNERKVKVEGEVYFEVQKGDKPFVVENLGPTVKVYGTEFNVNSYADEATVAVSLVEGRVALLVNGNEQFLVPGQVSYYNKTQKAIEIKSGPVDYLVCWKDGKYIFRDTPLSSIMRILQRRYNVNIELSKPGLGDYKYNATFHDEGLEQILGLLELSAPIKYKYIKRGATSDETGVRGKVIINEDSDRIVKY